jgi:tetratricopeptide (TPR) repeat protein
VQGNPYGVNRGDMEAALSSYREALAIPAGPIYLARAHRSIGELLPQRGDAAAAVPHFRAAIAALERASDPEGRRELALSYESLADVLGNTGLVSLADPAGARDAYGKALAIHESLGAQRGVAVIRMKLGDLALDAGDAATALKEFQATVPVLLDPRESGMVHRKIGGAYEALGKSREASDEYRRAAEIARERMLADPKNTQAQMDYAVALKDHADLEQKAEHWAAALPLYREILDIVGPISASRPDNVLLKSRHAEMLLNVGGLLAKLRRPDEGRRLYADGLRILKALADSPTATPGDRANYDEYLKHNPFEK